MTGICELIRICSESGVQNLTFGDLSVQFMCQNEKKDVESLTNVDYAPNNGISSTENPHDSGLTEEDRRSILLITDPVAYEEELLNN